MIARSTGKKNSDWYNRAFDRQKRTQIGTTGKKNSVPPFLMRCGLRWSGFGSTDTIFHMPVQQAGESVLLIAPLIQTDEGW